MTIPVVINNRDYLTYPRAMVERIRQWQGVGEVFIVDNASTYPPLLEWYDSTKDATVVLLGVNRGHTAPWSKESMFDGKSFIDTLPDRFYIETDPDLDLSSVPLDVIAHLHDGMMKNPDRIKVGLSLEINDLPSNGLLTVDEIMAFEGNNWYQRVGAYFDAPVDTTMAMYDKEIFMTPGDFNLALRTDRPYTARHLPWYQTNDNLTPEERYYIEHTEGWSYFVSRIKSRVK